MRISFPKTVVQLAIIVLQYMVQNVKELQHFIANQLKRISSISIAAFKSCNRLGNCTQQTTTLLGHVMRRKFSQKSLYPKKSGPALQPGQSLGGN
jgi:hypothetical protein